METGSPPKANSACKKGLKWDQIHLEKQKDSTKKCQTMEELQKQNLNLLDEVDGIRSKLTALTAREVRFEKEQSLWRDRERFLESKLAAYESKTAKRQTAGSVRETESRETEETSQTFDERQELADTTLNTQLQVCKQELVKFEVEQGKWRERERFLEAKISEYEKQKNAERGDGEDGESGEAVGEESSAETEDSIEPRQEQSGRVPEEIAALQNVVDSLKQELRFRRSKEQYFEKERARFSIRGKEQEAKIQRLESRVSELSERAQGNRTQSKTVDKPRTREIEVQTDFTMQTIDDLEAEMEHVQDEFDNLTHSFQSTGLKVNKERAEWREQRQELEDRATASESKLKAAEKGLVEREKALEKAREEWSLEKEKSMQKECDGLRELQESLKEYLAKYHAMEKKVIVLETERDSLKETLALSKEEAKENYSFNALRRKWEKASTSEASTTTETQSELCVDDSPAKQLKSNKSKEHDFEREREGFIAREKELEAKIMLLESQVTELREMDRKDCPQRETVDKPCTKEIEVQTDFTMHTIDDMEHEVEDVQQEFKHLVQSLRSAELNFNKERAEWREERRELEERATASESKLKATEKGLIEREKALEKAREEWSLEKEKSMQKECDGLRELQESLKEYLAKYHAMEKKVIVLETERDSLKETLALSKEESKENYSFNVLRRKWEKASTSEASTTTETQSELCVDVSPAKQLESNKSKEHDFEREREGFIAHEKELEAKIMLLESQVTELREMDREDCSQRETVDKPCTKEIEVQTDFTMHTIDDMEHEVEDVQQEFKHLVQSLRSADLKFNKERAEWSEQRQELEDRATASESNKSNQKECDELKEESLKEHLAKYHAMEQKVIVLEKERDSLEETVALLKEESTQKNEAAQRQQDKASTSETPAATDAFDPITQQQLDEMEIPKVRALVHRLRSHCGQIADALEVECERLRENAQTFSGKLEEHERNEVRLEAEKKEFERRAVEAETQLGKVRDDAVQKEKAFKEERDMFQEVEKQLRHLQKDNADLKTTVRNLTGQRRELEENAPVFQTSGASEALVSELRRQLQNEVTLRESLHRFHWEREKEFMAQQERLEDEKEQWVKRADELSEEKTQIFAMLEDKRLKTKGLEKKAEETELKREQMMQAFRDELRLRDQEKEETKLCYEQELERLRQKENEDKALISELTETLEQLGTKQKEAHEENKEHTAKEEQWKQAKEKLLSQIEILRATNDFNQRKKQRKGFFHRVFGRRN